MSGIGLLRFITCGSVDDGKSTLIGRLLHDAGALTDEQAGTAGLDLASLLDGLEDERAQGITIDVAYRYFSTPQRRFIVADCPGHEQYTRNMATGASTADAAVVLVDARKGLLPQTLRHTAIVAMFGVRRIILAVNKMDAIEYAHDVYDDIAQAFKDHLARLHPELDATCVPVSGLVGDNVVEPSASMPWYAGPTLLTLLERLPDSAPEGQAGFRLPVQWVNRADGFRGYCGNVAAGAVAPGARVVIAPHNLEATIARVIHPDGGERAAVSGDAVTLVFDREVDVSRSDVVASAEAPCAVSDQFSTRVLWMDAEPLLPGRAYWLQCGTARVRADLMQVKNRLDPETGRRLAATQLAMNEIGTCDWHLDRLMPYARFAENRELGAFIVVDRHTHATAGAGIIEHALRRADNVQWQPLQVGPAERARLMGHAGRCIWFTGLSGAGKSTIADQVETRLAARGVHTYLLDGDNVRHGLNRDLGFTAADRVENIRRVAEVARLMVDAGLVVIVSFISPFRADRQMARERFAAGDFIEVFVDAPLDVAEARDPKGLYAKARRGELPNFTGIDSPYEAPEHPELRLDTGRDSAAECANAVLALLDRTNAAG